MTTAEVITAMTKRIVNGFDPLQVILFGSHARGEASPESDIDLLVVLTHIADKRRTTVEILRALGDFAVPTDIVVTTPEEITRRGKVVGGVLRPALREGKVIYERS